MAREVVLSSEKYGLDPRFVYTFRKWSGSRATAELDWLTENFGASFAESVAVAVGAFVTGQASAAEAGAAMGEVFRSIGRAQVWPSFLRMASCDQTGGLYRKPRAQAGSSPGAMVWPADQAQQEAISGTDLDPEEFYSEDVTEVHRLVLAMLSESLRPFGRAREFAARELGSLAEGIRDSLAKSKSATTEGTETPPEPPSAPQS